MMIPSFLDSKGVSQQIWRAEGDLNNYPGIDASCMLMQCSGLRLHSSLFDDFQRIMMTVTGIP